MTSTGMDWMAFYYNKVLQPSSLRKIHTMKTVKELPDGRTEVELLIGADRATGIRFYESEHQGGGRMMHGMIVRDGVQRAFSVRVRNNGGRDEQYEYTIGDAEIVLDKDDIFDDFDDMFDDDEDDDEDDD